MALETGSFINDLVSTNPVSATDLVRYGAGHLRLLKSTIKTTFPNITGEITATHTELNYGVGVTSAIQTQITSKAAHAGQTYTGTHVFSGVTSITVPTKSASDNTTAAASTAYVDAADALKAPLASPVLTGAPIAPTAALGTSTTQIATTAFAQTMQSPAFTGIPIAPTPSTSNSTTQIATTEFTQALVAGSISSGAPAPVWVSGATYAIGNVVYSPLSLLSYRCAVAGVSTVDPRDDGVTWVALNAIVPGFLLMSLGVI